MKMQFGRLGAVFAVAAVVAGQGCATESSVQVRSVQSPVVDAPAVPTAVYSWVDRNTAQIYLTDLDGPSLDLGSPVEGISGRIVHIHMFLVPSAGDTPIEASACSVTVRHIVLANGEIGIYGGGGFLNPSTRHGRREFRGRVREATLRLVASTPGFADRLGPASMDATIAAERDEGAARRIGLRVEELLRRAGSAKE